MSIGKPGQKKTLLLGEQTTWQESHPPVSLRNDNLLSPPALPPTFDK
jgi:hypothetical protein